MSTQRATVAAEGMTFQYWIISSQYSCKGKSALILCKNFPYCIPLARKIFTLDLCKKITQITPTVLALGVVTCADGDPWGRDFMMNSPSSTAFFAVFPGSTLANIGLSRLLSVKEQSLTGRKSAANQQMEQND